ncbi:hypothetical protein SAMN05216167_102770 [Spirosoma endophyticum]|uniref:Uncharacterized protein n=2 Tax=Spirosoma endophyticum TaxID=662367 RepID=A0A1I1MY69_9BACT|nr:hypothetical protein SAMN05216167_102770 [Spirosoma endophyticum]
MRSTATILLLASLLLTSCQSLKSNLTAMSQQKKYCEPAFRFDYDSTYLPIPDFQSVIQKDTSLANRFSSHDLLVANAAGILPSLHEFIILKTVNRESNDRELSAKRQQINDRISLASMQISSIAAELDCEAERANRLANYLQQMDSKRIQQLTVLSVVVGALTTVATAFIQSDTPSKTVSIGGGAISAFLAGKAAFASKRTIHLVDQRNLLTDIWNQHQRSTVYPPFVWYMLTDKSFSYGGQHSISFNTRQRWVDYSLDGTSAQEVQMYFAAEGDYRADNLSTRAEMLNQLQSEVRLIVQDLQSLLLNVSKQF